MKNPSRRRRLLAVRSIAIVTNPEKIRAADEMGPLRAWLKDRGIKILPFSQLSRVDVILTLGGDGTILSVAPKAALAGVPVLGINVGRLGFMTAAGLEQLYEALESCVNGRWTISKRLMLEVEVPRSKGPHLALNDAVIRIGSTTRITTINAMIGNEDLGCFTGDGVIVATPTGSTAYSLAAQGPIVHPEMEAIVLTPICAHSFTQRPVVFTSGHTLTLWSQDRRVKNELQLCLDGQRVFRLNSNDRVIVRRSHHKLKLLQDPKMSYFGVLREKLSWGGK